MPIPLINNQILEDESLWFLLDPIVEFVSSHSDLLSSSPYRNIVMILHPVKVDLRIDFNVLHYHHTRGWERHLLNPGSDVEDTVGTRTSHKFYLDEKYEVTSNALFSYA